MSKHYFGLEEFSRRQRQVRAEMTNRGLDLLVIMSPINIMYLVGSALKSYQTFQCLFFSRDDDRPTTYLLRLSDLAEAKDHSLADDIRSWGGTHYEDPTDAFASVLEEFKLGKSRIGIEMPSYYLSVRDYLKLQPILSDYETLEATNLIESIKTVKSPAELEYVKKAAEIADVGLAAIERSLEAGRTEREIAAEAHQAMYAAGGDSPASPMNFVSGERTCYAHGAPSDRVLQTGDFIHVEFGGSYRRYCSTIARHFSIGAPHPRAQLIHDTTLRASDAALKAMKPGVPAEAPHLAAVAVAEEAGLGSYNIHTTGYGIAPGFPPSWGESINMFYGAQEPLRSGMVLSVEPPIFIHEEQLGARLIDCAVVGEAENRILSSYPRDIVVV